MPHRSRHQSCRHQSCLGERSSRRSAILPARQLLFAAVMMVMTGCSAVGESGQAAAEVTHSFYRALAAGDEKGACALLASSTREEMCRSPLPELDPPGPTLESQVWGQSAQVRLDGDVVFLVQEAGRWTVRAAGCRPQPPGPYDCEVEG